MTDAIDMLKDYAQKRAEILQRTGYSNGYFLERHCVQLLSACCAKNDVPQAVELINVLFDCGYVKPGTFVVLKTLVEGYLKK